MMRIYKARVVTTGECAAFVSRLERPLDRRWHGARLATDIQRLAIFVLANNQNSSTSSSWTFVPIAACRTFLKSLPLV